MSKRHLRIIVNQNKQNQNERRTSTNEPKNNTQIIQKRLHIAEHHALVSLVCLVFFSFVVFYLEKTKENQRKPKKPKKPNIANPKTAKTEEKTTQTQKTKPQQTSAAHAFATFQAKSWLCRGLVCCYTNTCIHIQKHVDFEQQVRTLVL